MAGSFLENKAVPQSTADGGSDEDSCVLPAGAQVKRELHGLSVPLFGCETGFVISDPAQPENPNRHLGVVICVLHLLR